MEPSNLNSVDWSTLPTPDDDGAADHLTGLQLPNLSLPSTMGGAVALNPLPGRIVFYVYPLTGQPGVALPEGWDRIPGARGCTPQSCSFRDHFADLKAAGTSAVFGLSTQTTDYQSEVATRLHLPFALLSDASLELATTLKLPTMQVGGDTLLKRMAMIIDDAIIKKVFYPVFPPDQNAIDVLAWLKANPQ